MNARPADQNDQVALFKLLFAMNWEDPASDRRALTVKAGETVMTVTSGCCNTFTLLLDNPAKIFAVDINPSQSYLLELKSAAIRQLECQELHRFLGLIACKERPQIFERLSGETSLLRRSHIEHRRAQSQDETDRLFSAPAPAAASGADLLSKHHHSSCRVANQPTVNRRKSVRFVHSTRSLNPKEINLARKVFGINMPHWNDIGITDGLGKHDRIWTHPRQMFPILGTSTYRYFINFGDAYKVDLSVDGVDLGRYVPGYSGDEVDDVFIHEMTHIWQYSRVSANWADIALRCVYAQNSRAGYAFTEGDPWSDYNLEQQASIVELWNKRKRKEDDVLYPYIHYILKGEGHENYKFPDKWWTAEADLAQLQFFLDMERVPTSMEKLEPVQSVVKDDSFIVVLNGDVMFAFGKADLQAGADAMLQKAWAIIQRNPRRQKVYINGHTDGVGKDAVNQTLSERRAQEVADWFVKRGYLNRAIIVIQGFGKTRPIAPNTTAEGRTKNRRVEIDLRNQ